MCRKSRNVYTICSNCLPPVWTQARRCWRYIAKYKLNHTVIQICSLVLDASFQLVDMRDLGMQWRRTFWVYNVKMMWLTTHLTIFKTLTASYGCGHSIIHYNILAFANTSQATDWESHLWNELWCVEWDVKFNSCHHWCSYGSYW